MPDTESRIRAAEAAALHRRTLKLAESKSEAPEGEVLHTLVFELGGTSYAVESAYVEEVLPVRGITRVPCAPPFVLGIVNIHGRILSLLDLRALLETGRTTPDTQSRWAVVLRHAGMSFCLYAESLGGIRRVPVASVFSEAIGDGVRRRLYVRGVTAERVVVLSAHAMLTDNSLVVDDRGE